MLFRRRGGSNLGIIKRTGGSGQCRRELPIWIGRHRGVLAISGNSAWPDGVQWDHLSWVLRQNNDGVERQVKAQLNHFISILYVSTSNSCLRGDFRLAKGPRISGPHRHIAAASYRQARTSFRSVKLQVLGATIGTTTTSTG